MGKAIIICNYSSPFCRKIVLMNTYKIGKCLNVLQNEESLSAVMIKFPILKEVKQFEAYNMGNKSRIRNKEIPT